MLATILQALPQESRFDRLLDIFMVGAVPVILAMLENRRRARKDAKVEQAKIQSDLETKHRENTKRLDKQDDKLDEIISERKYIPAHLHREISGPLSTEGIFPRKV